MPLTLESGTLVWRRVRAFLTATGVGKNPGIQAQFEALKEWLVEQKGNPQLQFIPFTDAQVTTATGYSPIGAGATLYAVYFSKSGAGSAGTATDSWLTIANDASNVTDTTKFVALMTSVAKQEVAAFYPNGLIFGTDVTISGETSAQDGTESTVGDSGPGFLIVGAL